MFSNGRRSNSSVSNGTRTTGNSKSSAANNKQNKNASSFHPKLITAQIVALQCFHYFLWAILIQINSAIYGKPVTIDRIFTDRHVKIWHVTGWADCIAILMVSVAGAVFLAIIVEKSKKCLDFSVTLFVVHLILTTLYGGFPTHLEWWIVHITGTTVMILGGEHLCARRELDDIPLLQL